MSWQPRRYHEGGYLVIDHRASPGMSPDLARASGFDPREVSEGKILEGSTLTCCHCKTTVFKNPLRTRARESCYQCNHYICDFCHADMQRSDYVHTPYEAKVEQAIKQR